jgi:hypothetical protein
MPVVSATCYELLGVPVEAPIDAIEGAWKLRRREAERRLGALPAEEVEALCARVDEAYRILADPIRADRYRRYRAQFERDVPAGEWGHDPDAVGTDPALAAWSAPPEPAGDLDLLADVVRAAELVPLPDGRDLPPWRTPDAPVVRAAQRSPLAPAAFPPGERRPAPAPPPWSR